jgi:hypothetical protein
MTTCHDFTSIFYIWSLNLVCPLTNMFTRRAKHVQSIVMGLFLTMFNDEIGWNPTIIQIMDELSFSWMKIFKKTKWKTKMPLITLYSQCFLGVFYKWLDYRVSTSWCKKTGSWEMNPHVLSNFKSLVGHEVWTIQKWRISG